MAGKLYIEKDGMYLVSMGTGASNKFFKTTVPLMPGGGWTVQPKKDGNRAERRAAEKAERRKKK